MKNTFKLFVTLFFLTVTLNQGMSQNTGIDPTFTYTVKNIQTFPNTAPNGQVRDSLLTFDIYLLHTNPAVSNSFEYGASQFTIWYNKAAKGAGNWLLTKVSSPLPNSMQFPTFQVDTTLGLLKGSGNIPQPAENYYVSPTFPGLRLVTMRLRTTLHQWPVVPLGLRFKLGAAPNTFVAYLLPYDDTTDTFVFPNQFAKNLMDTVANQYSVDNSGFVLPVELANFVSNVNKNNVTLNWSTNKETNNQGFDIERSVVGSEEWSKVGNVAGNGTTNEIKNYSFSERASTGHYSYRLKQIDFNGNFEYFSLNNEVIVGVPSVYAISQNYPNPFNPSTKIDFELPYDGKVSILLYDISGREVGKLVNEVLTAGYHTVQFNGSNLSSGMYFYRINATGGSQNFVTTKKMVLIK